MAKFDNPQGPSFDLDRLVASLNLSQLQSKNQPLYYVIYTLIKALQSFQSSATVNINNNSLLKDLTYLTVNDETVSLPNSRQELAGDNVSFDDSVAGERTIDVPLNQVFLTGANEVATLPNSRRLLAGTGITFDDTVANQRTINSSALPGYWTLLTDGDVDETDFIFASGDAISVFVPL